MGELMSLCSNAIAHSNYLVICTMHEPTFPSPGLAVVQAQVFKDLTPISFLACRMCLLFTFIKCSPLVHGMTAGKHHSMTTMVMVSPSRITERFVIKAVDVPTLCNKRRTAATGHQLLCTRVQSPLNCFYKHDQVAEASLVSGQACL